MFQYNGIWLPIKEKFITSYKLYTDEMLQPTKAIQKIFKEGKVKNEDGKIIKLTDAVDPYEGYFLYSVIKENKFKRVLEIGMANGMSAIYMCSALKEVQNLEVSDNQLSKVSQKELSKSEVPKPFLISIDPFQKSQWKNTGLQTLRDAKLLSYHMLIEELDYLALPKLLKEFGPESFDLIFIDGNHLFDYTVLDFFFAEKLLRIGGLIVLDDIRHENTGKGYKYIQKNYINLVELKNTINFNTQGTFMKIAKDQRPWFFHIDF